MSLSLSLYVTCLRWKTSQRWSKWCRAEGQPLDAARLPFGNEALCCSECSQNNGLQSPACVTTRQKYLDNASDASTKPQQDIFGNCNTTWMGTYHCQWQGMLHCTNCSSQRAILCPKWPELWFDQCWGQSLASWLDLRPQCIWRKEKTRKKKVYTVNHTFTTHFKLHF